MIFPYRKSGLIPALKISFKIHTRNDIFSLPLSYPLKISLASDFSFSNKCRKYIWFYMQTTQACYLIQICICLISFETVTRLFTYLFFHLELKAQTVCWILILLASQHQFSLYRLVCYEWIYFDCFDFMCIP